MKFSIYLNRRVFVMYRIFEDNFLLCIVSLKTTFCCVSYLWRQLFAGQLDVAQLTSINRWPAKVIIQPAYDKTYKMACAPSEDSDQSGHPSSLIRIFTVRMKKACVLSYPLNAQRRLWWDWADAQAELNLHWAHMPFCTFCHMLVHMCLKVYYK